MEIVFTKDAQKLVAACYKSYLEKRKSGIDKTNAKYCDINVLQPSYFPDISRHDYKETAAELCRAMQCRMFLDGSFMLSDAAICYMENRFKDGVKDTLSFLSQFIP